MWTFGAINLVVTFGFLAAGAIGFIGGWLTRRAVVEQRQADKQALGAGATE